MSGLTWRWREMYVRVFERFFRWLAPEIDWDDVYEDDDAVSL